MILFLVFSFIMFCNHYTIDTYLENNKKEFVKVNSTDEAVKYIKDEYVFVVDFVGGGVSEIYQYTNKFCEVNNKYNILIDTFKDLIDLYNIPCELVNEDNSTKRFICYSLFRIDEIFVILKSSIRLYNVYVNLTYDDEQDPKRLFNIFDEMTLLNNSIKKIKKRNDDLKSNYEYFMSIEEEQNEHEEEQNEEGEQFFDDEEEQLFEEEEKKTEEQKINEIWEAEESILRDIAYYCGM